MVKQNLNQISIDNKTAKKMVSIYLATARPVKGSIRSALVLRRVKHRNTYPSSGFASLSYLRRCHHGMS